MARSLHLPGLIAVLAALSPLPAQAQFNPFEALFGTPPRPPAGVPTDASRSSSSSNIRNSSTGAIRTSSTSARPISSPIRISRSSPIRRRRTCRPAIRHAATCRPATRRPMCRPAIRRRPTSRPASSRRRPVAAVAAAARGTAAIEPRGPGASPYPAHSRCRGSRPASARRLATPRSSPATRWSPSRRRRRSSTRARCSPASTRSPAASSISTSSIGETVQFGALQVTPRACYTRPPTETPNTDAFVEVDEVTLQGEVKRIFTGWMFAASPGLHGVEHPIYDVWLSDCKSPPVAAAPARRSVADAECTAVPIPPRRPAAAAPGGERSPADRLARCCSAATPSRQPHGCWCAAMSASSASASAPGHRTVGSQRGEIGFAGERRFQQPVILRLRHFDRAEALEMFGDELRVAAA